jgi:hypothetical protein
MPRRPTLPGIPLAAVEIARAQDGLITTAQAESCGLNRGAIEKLARTGGWRRVLRGVWWPPFDGRGDLTLLQRSRAAVLAVGEGVICLPTAAALLGVDGAPRDDRIHISIDPDATRSQCAGVVLHWFALGAADVVDVDGLRCTSPQRLLFDAARAWDRDHVVSTLDSSLNRGVIDGSDLDGLAQRLPARRRGLVALADGRSESPLESRVRLLLVDAGTAPEELQHELRDADGRLVARLDLAWPSRRVAVECDGLAYHSDPQALLRDRARQDDINHLGWRLIRVTWDDWLHRPHDVVRRVRRALAAAA